MRILFATDIREPELDRRLDGAVHWAKKLSGTLDLLYVTPEFAETHYLGSDSSRLQYEIEKMVERQQLELTRLQQRIPETHRGTIEVLTAPRAGEAIAEHATGYELLILYTHGRKGLSHFFMGSIAERVVRIATVPTLTLQVSARVRAGG